MTVTAHHSRLKAGHVGNGQRIVGLGLVNLGAIIVRRHPLWISLDAAGLVPEGPVNVTLDAIGGGAPLVGSCILRVVSNRGGKVSNRSDVFVRLV
jgi:hypothetical protein